MVAKTTNFTTVKNNCAVLCCSATLWNDSINVQFIPQADAILQQACADYIPVYFLFKLQSVFFKTSACKTFKQYGHLQLDPPKPPRKSYKYSHCDHGCTDQDIG